MGQLETAYAGAPAVPATFAVVSGIGVVASLFFTMRAPLWLLLAGVCLAVCLATGVAAANRAKALVEIYERGLLVKRGDESDTFTYDDIKNVWYRGRKTPGGAQTGSRFTIELNDGRKVGVEPATFKNGAELASALYRELTVCLAARARLDLLAGKRLSFGTIQVSTAGLSNGQEEIPWSEVNEPRINAGTVTLYRRGGRRAWARVSTATTPNVLALLMIANAINVARVP